MWIMIEAHDVLMFRDSKPFAAGQSFVARSIFPPNPQVMTGVLRSAVVEAAGISFPDFQQGKAEAIYAKIGNPQEKNPTLGNLKLRGPFVCKMGQDQSIELLFPLPQDVLYDDEHGLFITLQPSRKLRDSMKTDPPFTDWIPLGLPALPPPPEGKDYSFENTTAWLPAATFQAYLAGQPIASQIIRNDAVFAFESHIGLGLDYNRRAADEANRLFYRAEFVRPYTDYASDYQIRLLLEINDTFLQQERGFLRMGGEGRFGAYETVKKYEFPLTPPTQHKGRLKIVLLTPAYFSDGWQPINEDWSQWLGKKAKLVSIAAASPTIISGWDMVANKAKPLYRYMAAGSVYYFEGAEIPTIPFTESPSTLAAGAMGFGGFAVGTWDYLD
jgi:CRISPR-associated protein Cmr3